MSKKYFKTLLESHFPWSFFTILGLWNMLQENCLDQKAGFSNMKFNFKKSVRFISGGVKIERCEEENKKDLM